MRRTVAALVGPTAVGKTELAVSVAETLGAEIVSIDSMQVYRRMDVGTDKPSPELRRRVPHHMIDVFDPAEEVTVAQFQATARAAVDDISSRGRLPLLVGGSGLYFRAVVDPLEFPPHAPEVRERLEEEAETKGARHLHARLAGVDPVAAGRIEPSNARRTIRALEVIEITGRPFSQDSWDRYESIYDLSVVGLTRPRDELDERVAARVDRMLMRGLVDEARAVAGAGMSRAPRQALGYRQVLEAPSADEVGLRDEIVRATRRFARRQEAWFRSDPRVVWVDASRADVGERIVAEFRRALGLP